MHVTHVLLKLRTCIDHLKFKKITKETIATTNTDHYNVIAKVLVKTPEAHAETTEFIIVRSSNAIKGDNALDFLVLQTILLQE